jgi:hypothetical protein
VPGARPIDDRIKEDQMNSQLPTMRELHHRVSDGIHVRLLWREDVGQLTVTVADGRIGAAFAVDVHEGERPMDVFLHPYAYAAHHGVDTSAVPQVEEPEVSVAA